MTQIDRLLALRELVAKDPKSPFPRYGLAMELKGRGLHDEALREFRALLDASPTYATGYYHLGVLLRDMGRGDEASAVLRDGIAASEKKGDFHTRDEIAEVLAAING